MKINEVAIELHNKRRQLMVDSYYADYEPSMVVYMSREYWLECKSELRGSLSPAAYEFYQNNTLMGFNVWAVDFANIDGKSVSHPPFRVVNID